MRIFIYSDVHISKSSSILPQKSSNEKYTYRQNMIIETGKYLASIIDEEKPDIIMNLGDTFDQHTLTSYDVNVASEFFNCFKYINIPHLVLVGNHEMINYDFNAIKLLSNIQNITVISKPTTIDLSNIKAFYPSDVTMSNTINENSGNATNVKIALMPYMEYKDILSFPDGEFLFSHIDIMGMQIRGNFELPDGVTKEQLAKYKLVFNGHIHKASFKNNVVNVGSVTTHSFADDSDSVPKCYIFDTDTLDLKAFKPNVCPLFRKIEIKNNLEELFNIINGLDNNYKYVLQVVCPYELKTDVRSVLDNNTDKIITYKLNVRVSENKEEKLNDDVAVNVQSNLDIKMSFKDFLNSVDELKYPKTAYENILDNIQF